MASVAVAQLKSLVRKGGRNERKYHKNHAYAFLIQNLLEEWILWVFTRGHSPTKSHSFSYFPFITLTWLMSEDGATRQICHGSHLAPGFVATVGFAWGRQQAGVPKLFPSESYGKSDTVCRALCHRSHETETRATLRGTCVKAFLFRPHMDRTESGQFVRRSSI